MDRLSLIAVLGFLFVFTTGIGCQDKTEPTPIRSRVVGVEAKTEHVRSLEEYCDVIHAASDRVVLNVPPLEHASLPGTEKARWINIWATWCKPCIEEMPMLVRWAERMNNNGKAVELKFVSADDTAQVVSSFLSKHPEIGASFRLVRSDSLQPWMRELGLDEAAGLPIHIFIGKGGFVRCVRAAAIGRGDFDIIQQIL
jgi:thiol-disulfide isomerase/thioredoxin